MRCFFCLLVVDPYDIIPPGCGKKATIACIINSKDLIISLDSMPELLASLGDELKNVAIGIGS
jgi:hypothetical protein